MRVTGVVRTTIVLLASAIAAMAQPLGTAFTYQGRLVDGGQAANGLYDLQLILFDAAVGGSQVGAVVLKDDVTVTNGLFTVTVDFGAQFTGQKLFLDVGVRPGASSGAYTVLSPRQELTAAPNALFSANAATVGGLSCANGQVAKWNNGWTCGTDANSGGTISSVVAGNGLTGGASSGPATLDVGQGTGIVVAADAISLDTAFTDLRYDLRYDPRYVNVTGDVMSGNLDMAQTRVLSRGCPSGQVHVGPGLCTDFTDVNGFTFAGCADHCRVQGTHMCSSAEMLAVMQSSATLDAGGVLLDWVDDQDSATNALFVNSTAPATAMADRATSTSSFCRCCANVE
jgi:hypothetical protein